VLSHSIRALRSTSSTPPLGRRAMPACSCPAIACGVCAVVQMMPGIAFFFWFRRLATSPSNYGLLILSQLGESDSNPGFGTEFITNYTIDTPSLDAYPNVDLNVCELYMDAAAGTKCDDVFDELTVTFECSEDTHDDCAILPEKVDTEKDCKTEILKGEYLAPGVPDKVVKVASFKGTYGKVNGELRSTGNYRVKSASDVAVSGFWTAGLELTLLFSNAFSIVVLGVTVALGGVCCCCAGGIFFMTSSS